MIKAGFHTRGVFEILKTDMLAMGIKRTGVLSMAYHFFISPNFQAVMLFRLSSTCASRRSAGKAASLFFWRLNVLLNACDIHPLAAIGDSFSIFSPIGIVIGQVDIGRNAEIFHKVTIGSRLRREPYDGPRSRPQIGDNVTMYTGAVVIGPTRIGNNVIVAANSVVVDDVPDFATAFGIPARTSNESPDAALAV